MSINRNNTDPKYWEAILKSENLDMSRGNTKQDARAEAGYCAFMAAQGIVASEDEVRDGFIIKDENGEVDVIQ